MGSSRRKRRRPPQEEPRINRKLFDKALERARTHPKIEAKPRFG